MNVLPRADVWFEIHGNLLWPECKSYGEPYIAWLKQQQIPIYMQDQSLVSNACVFPKDELAIRGLIESMRFLRTKSSVAVGARLGI